jgi:hypothetical protein
LTLIFGMLSVLKLLLAVIWFVLILFLLLQRFKDNPRDTASHFTYWVLFLHVIFFGFLLLSSAGGYSPFIIRGVALTIVWQLGIVVLVGSLIVLILYRNRVGQEAEKTNTTRLVTDQIIIHVFPLVMLYLVAGFPRGSFVESSLFSALFIVIYLLSLVSIFKMEMWESYKLQGKPFVYLTVVIGFILSYFAVKGLSFAAGRCGVKTRAWCPP